MRRLSSTVTAILIAMTASAGQASDIESEILQHVAAETDRAIDLLESAVNINSGTMNFAGVRAVGELFMHEFEELGFDVRWVDGEAFGRAGHLVANRESVGPKVLLIGHLDTVFPADSPFQKFQRLDDNYASGPGIIDMKGGNVVMIQALRALQATGQLDQLSLTAVLTGDEEFSGRPLADSKKALVDAAIWADYAIGFEDGDGNPETAVVSRRSSASWTLEVTGRPGHSSQIFQDEFGYGAIFEAARILDRFRRDLSGYELLTFNPGSIVGGTETDFDAESKSGSAFGKNNVIPQTALASGDVRAISPRQLAGAQEKMRTIVAENLAHTSAVLSFGEGYPPMAPSKGNLTLLAMFDKASRDHGLGAVEAVNPRNAGAADISFTAEHVGMAMDGVGLMGSGGHTVDEVADLRTLPQQTQRVAILLYRLAVPGD